jgi:hypothetical protein
MTDLVERLRWRGAMGTKALEATMHEAADTIEYQAGEIERLRNGAAVDWRIMAYTRLGQLRDSMADADVEAVQGFLGPLGAAMEKP